MADSKTQLVAGLFFVLIANACCVPMDQFYPFGVLQNDMQLSSVSRLTLVTSCIDLPVPVIFYGQERDSICVRIILCSDFVLAARKFNDAACIITFYSKVGIDQGINY